MKLIHYEKGSKIFLGSNFTSDLDVLLNKAKLQHNKVVLVTGIKSFIKTDFYAKLKNIFRKNQIIIVNHVKIGPNPSESHIMHTLSGLDCEFDS